MMKMDIMTGKLEPTHSGGDDDSDHGNTCPLLENSKGSMSLTDFLGHSKKRYSYENFLNESLQSDEFFCQIEKVDEKSFDGSFSNLSNIHSEAGCYGAENAIFMQNCYSGVESVCSRREGKRMLKNTSGLSIASSITRESNFSGERGARPRRRGGKRMSKNVSGLSMESNLSGESTLSREKLAHSRRGGKRMVRNTSGFSARSVISCRSRTSVRSLLSATKGNGSVDSPELFEVEICTSPFDKLFELGGELGKGTYGIVLECISRDNAEFSHAVKCIDRKSISEEDLECFLDEVAIAQEIKHENIVHVYDFFIEENTYFLVMERLDGGELFDQIVAKGFYEEEEARITCKNILEAVKYCHFKRVAHRDVKPENLLLSSKNDVTNVKLADFGFATIVTGRNSLRTMCGTPGYAAPEILDERPYDERADMWSVGVTLYALLGGYLPFEAASERDVADKVIMGEYDFEDESWGDVSGDAKHLIRRLLQVDPDFRLTAAQALKHPWIVRTGTYD